MDEEHTADLWNVNEGDHVTIETTEGTELDATCDLRNVENADPRTGEIRETTIWLFSAGERRPAVAITQGLKSSPDDPEFPIHNKMFDRVHDETLGYIETVQIHGPKLEGER